LADAREGRNRSEEKQRGGDRVEDLAAAEEREDEDGAREADGGGEQQEPGSALHGTSRERLRE
jgi:hypothetical protein